MQLTQVIANHISEAYEGDNWSDVCVKDLVQGINFSEAITVTKASPNSIASLLYHMMFYNKAICQRLRGKEPQINTANGFDMPPLKDESAWQQLIKDAMDSANDLAEAVRSFPDQKLFEERPAGKGSYYKKLHGVIEHNYYHLGQIQILKKLIKSQ